MIIVTMENRCLQSMKVHLATSLGVPSESRPQPEMA
jgi:hypothetical protein